jgi:hypothetical protein
MYEIVIPDRKNLRTFIIEFFISVLCVITYSSITSILIITNLNRKEYKNAIHK